MARGGKRRNAGRPRGARNKLTAAANATLTEMARAYTEEMLGLLVAVARGEIDANSSRIHAIEGVLDRGNGKPVSMLEVSGPRNAPAPVPVINLFGRPEPERVEPERVKPVATNTELAGQSALCANSNALSRAPIR
jgi:hypothetical protein